jgi:hypothetical protein
MNRKTSKKSSRKVSRKASKKIIRRSSRHGSKKSSKKTSRKGSTRKRRITNFTLKVGTVTYHKDKLLYINITGNLIYISWPTGRTYFKLDSDEYKKTIKEIKVSDKDKKLFFMYDGEWETNMWHSGKTKHLKKQYVFTFNDENDYKMMSKLMM